VIESVPVTLLSIPNKVKYAPINKIAFTTRFKSKDHKALEQVIAFANGVHAEVKCLHVKTSDSDTNDALVNKWRDDFKNDPVEFIIIPDDDVEGTIFEFLEKENIGILSMLTYKHTFFKNCLELVLPKTVVS